MIKSKMLMCLLLVCGVAVSSCSGQSNNGEKETEVLLETTAGEIRIKLYNDTPGHRDNFIKNVKDGSYDGVTFHRIIRSFMIQTGDPDTRVGMVKDTTKVAPTIPSEIVYPKHFHKRGVVAAAREGDDENPNKESDMFQFYIVTGRYQNDDQLRDYEKAKYEAAVNKLYEAKAKAHEAELEKMRKARDRDGVSDLLESLLDEANAEINANPPADFTQEQRRAYKTYGGAPWLDGDYTVFGEVVEGMKVVGIIEKVKTDENDAPLQEVRILKATVLE